MNDARATSPRNRHAFATARVANATSTTRDATHQSFAHRTHRRRVRTETMPYEYQYQNDYELIQSFNAADADRSGSIEGRELQRALAASGLVFSLQTVMLLIRMHATVGSDENRLGFEQYKVIHQFLVNAQNSFSHFDRNRSGKLGKDEIFEALAYQGYGDVDATAIKHACKAFDPDRSNDLSIDQYIGLSLFLTAARRVFTSFDRERKGTVSMDFNQFVFAASKTR